MNNHEALEDFGAPQKAQEPLQSQETQLQDFGQEDPTGFLDEPIDTVVAFRDRLSPVQIHKLIPLLAIIPAAEDPQVYGADFDMADEVNQQILAVRAMRESIMEEGRIKDGIATREVKEVIAASNTMLSALMKFHKEIINLHRMRAIEKATIKVLKDMGHEEKFLEQLETELEAIDG